MQTINFTTTLTTDLLSSLIQIYVVPMYIRLVFFFKSYLRLTSPQVGKKWRVLAHLKLSCLDGEAILVQLANTVVSYMLKTELTQVL